MGETESDLNAAYHDTMIPLYHNSNNESGKAKRKDTVAGFLLAVKRRESKLCRETR